ncbi:STAS domain-containing protein [Salinibacillus xinjiangensis]|uniref:STAS domain-containing protein n=1 Tax=Salinibacillus xinjiangensis TaxID=1229268 RepID=A0A6G1X2I7_9BACI|nr:STAS domain-containing protein [Salinibacillus xinjiangensis]MRG85038.1 STAS domain-containing protein [Salinibacillus xinjiangensis]
MKDTVEVKKEIDDNQCILHVSGVLDYSTMEPFIEEIQSIEEGIAKVVVHFGGLEFIDSTGIGSIINLVHEANTKKFEVELDGINEEIQELFETIGVFEIMDSIQKGGE